MRVIIHICLFIFVGQCYAQRSDFETISFNKADSIALAFKGEKLTNIPELSYKLTSKLETDVEKFRAIFKWICDNIANDYPQYSRNKRKRYRFRDDEQQLADWNLRFRKTAFKRLIKDNKATCTGYAYLMRELAKHANLNCKIVNGYARTSTINIERIHAPNHSWNAIEINGKWYLCDPTWASGIQNPETLKFEFFFNEGLFLTDPEVFGINHYPIDENWLLFSEDAPTYDSFLEAPVLYGYAYNNISKHTAPKKMHSDIKKDETVVFKYILKKPIAKGEINLLIDNGVSSRTVQPEIFITDENVLTLEYTFKRTGFYDVHFFIDGDPISTYTFRVKK